MRAAVDVGETVIRLSTMLAVSMSQFADFCLSTGAARVTEARSHGGQPFDLYADWKAAVLNRLARGEPLGTAAEMWPGLEGDAKKAKRYPVLLDGMRAWGAGVTDEIVTSNRETSDALHGVRVRVNPEIALKMPTGHLTPVKLYLRTAPLTKARVALLCGLMADGFELMALPCINFAVLDVARARLHYGGTPAALTKVRDVLRAEALCYAALRGGR